MKDKAPTFFQRLLTWRRPHGQAATKHDLQQLKECIMSAISDYVAAVNASHEAIQADVDSLGTSFTGVSSDVAALKALIEKLQSNPGPITPEDQALLDQSQATAAALATKTKAFATALKELDDSTGEPLPPPPPPAPPA